MSRTSPVTETLPEWEDADVQLVYEMLCDPELNSPPNPEEHWEGWVSRNIVRGLRSRRYAQRPADELAELIAAKAAEPAFVEFAKRMPALNEVSFLPFFKVGPTAVTHWRVALMSGREIGLSDEELKSAVSLSSTILKSEKD
jgi:hypothetical protein